MDSGVVAIIATLVSAPAFTALITAWFARRSNQLSVDKAQLEMRIELHKVEQELREELRLTRQQNDELTELVNQKEATIRNMELSLKTAEDRIAELQDKLVQASLQVAALTREAVTLRERVQVLEGGTR